jgi:high-affinity Fe2+/Pb2+ permease
MDVMRTVAIVVVAVALLGLSLGWLLDRRGGGSTLADRLRFTSHFLLRVYVAVIFGWSTVVLARHHDALHLVFATILGLIMIWSIFMAGVFAWGLWRPSSDTE